MLYKNTKTGAVIDTPCTVVGGDWVNAEAETKLNSQSIEDVAEAAGDGKKSLDLSELTVAELRVFATENGINLESATRKDDIIKMIAAADAVEVE